MLRAFYLLPAALLAAAQTAPVAITGARVIPIAGPEIDNGVVVFQNGRIVSVGGANSAIPQAARRIDARGKVVMPGFVDSHSHIGGVEGGDSSGPIQPEVRVLDAINVRDARIQKAQAGGITVANVMPGSGHLSSGQTLYLKLRDGKAIDDLLIKLPDGSIAGGLKMANGTNSRRDPPFPGTRSKSVALVRDQFIKAREYANKVQQAGGDASKLPPRDLRLETLGETLAGKRIVQFHTHRHDDILTVLRLQREFGFRVVLQHASDAWAVADDIAKSAVLGVSLILIDSPGGKIEAKDNNLNTAAVLEKAGVLTGFHTDDGVTDSRWLNRMAALAVRAGMSREKALYGLTMASARLLELDRRVGSLEPGKDADVVILSGDPLSVYTKIEQTWVDGVKVFDRADPKDRLYAVGGYGASHDQGSAIFDESEHEGGAQ
jgi:imidazolonepropionase-like amidohydrolase